MKSINPLSEETRWKILYHNSSGICQNCGTTGTHTCVIDFKNKTLKFDDGLINIQVLFELGFKFDKTFIDSIP